MVLNLTNYKKGSLKVEPEKTPKKIRLIFFNLKRLGKIPDVGLRAGFHETT